MRIVCALCVMGLWVIPARVDAETIELELLTIDHGGASFGIDGFSADWYFSEIHDRFPTGGRTDYWDLGGHVNFSAGPLLEFQLINRGNGYFDSFYDFGPGEFLLEVDVPTSNGLVVGTYRAPIERIAFHLTQEFPLCHGQCPTTFEFFNVGPGVFDRTLQSVFGVTPEGPQWSMVFFMENLDRNVFSPSRHGVLLNPPFKVAGTVPEPRLLLLALMVSGAAWRGRRRHFRRNVA